MQEVLEHCEDADKVLSECRRVLKDDGRLIVTIPIGKELYNKSHILFWYDYYQVMDLFEKYFEYFKIYQFNKMNLDLRDNLWGVICDGRRQYSR